MKKHLLLLFSLFVSAATYAQVTTGSITGTVKDASGESLIGATVKATHAPSGSAYGASTNANGQFTIPNVRIGGPYTLVISYIGYNAKTITGLTVTLGNPLRVNVILENAAKALNEVTVSANKNAIISSERTGTSTNVSQAQLVELPTVTRNIQDFARFTPQATSLSNSSTGAPTGMSFAGMHNKYNRFSIDGATASDAFGLASTGTNGGQASANPIPLDAIQEMQVVLAPYDVTYVGFAGGGMNAVTKSGTNTFHGTAYTYLQNEDFIGENVNTGLKYPDFKKNIYGASIGGPLIKDKLFFFTNYEQSKVLNPVPYNPAEAGSGSKFDMATLQNVHDYILNTYQFDPGSYTDMNKKTPSTSLFARIDWNINEKNKLTIRHLYVDASDYVISRSPTTMTFSNSGYSFLSTTNSSVLELNSSLSSSASNVFRLTYNNINDRRETAEFPSIYLQEGGLNYNLGADYSSARNSLKQDNFSLVDNFTLYKNKHTLTFGTNNDFYNTNNVYMQYYYGYYTYKSVAALKNGSSEAPYAYSVGYSTEGPNDNAAAKMHAAQFRIYGQDAWTVNDKFKLTYGLGIELPVFFNHPDANATFNSSSFATDYNVATNKTAKASLYFTPRIAFNWDVKGDATTQLRGGAGIFTGPTPFVWVSNQYTNTGVASIKYSNPAGVRFNYDPGDSHLGAFIPGSYTAAPTEIDVADRDFKFPEMFRSNLAIDQKLPFWGLVGSLEALYTKTINNINYQNLNVAAPSGVVTLGNSTRPWYNFTRADNNYSDIIYLTNTSKGYTYNLTAQIQKPFSHGWTGSIAYTYGDAYSLTDGTSSTALSNWRYAYNINGLNNLDLARSNFSPGSRVIGYVAKSFRYANNRLATTIGLVYNGQSGQPFSYIYNNNISGDDISNKSSGADLAYIPASLEEAQFSNLTRTNADGSKSTISPQQQWKDFQAFVNDNEYLKDHLGKNTKRNGDRMPWENHFDLKVSQDFYFYKQHKLEVSFDMINVGNLLNKDWGHSYYISNQGIYLFNVSPSPATANPTFNFDITKMNTVDGKLKPYTVADYTSRFRGQLSLRYSF